MRWLPLLLVVALQIYALIDCIQTRRSDTRHLPKLAWLILIVIAPLLGAVGWLVFGRPRRVDAARNGAAPDAPRGPVGPEDDPEFLRQLRQVDIEHERMLKQWEEDLRRRERDAGEHDPKSGDPKRSGDDPDHTG
jgi:hypothetical protein